MILDGDSVARFAVSTRYLGTTPPVAKFGLFMPPDDLRLSVYWISGISEQEIWALGKTYVADPQEKTIKARADIIVNAARELALDVVEEPDPHPRHAEIVGWPDDRTRQRVIAMRLAQSAVLRTAP